jgi:hypothetical protein
MMYSCVWCFPVRVSTVALQLQQQQQTTATTQFLMTELEARSCAQNAGVFGFGAAGFQRRAGRYLQPGPSALQHAMSAL